MNRLRIALLGILMMIGSSLKAQAQVAEQDSLALVAFYQAMDGANWTFNTNWLSGPVSSWYGVSITGEHVTALNFVFNGLAGEIPSEIGNLSNLNELRLMERQNGNLTGEIPAELGNLANLSKLQLSGDLTGKIPVALGNLINLTELRLGNQLTGEIPVELSNLANLTALDLFGNQLTGEILVELSNLANLTVLRLGANQLTGEIPVELGNLTKLTVLNLASNQLTGEIPVELSNLINLTVLELEFNQLTGEIPEELGNLTALTYLILYVNQLTGEIPAALGDLTDLTRLQLDNNQLTGEIPEELGNLTALTYLSLSGNQLTGEIPAALGNLSNLTDLVLVANQLSGSIPSEMGNMSNLKTMFLSDNTLSGPVPSELGNLDNLEEWGLNDNLNLTGSIPLNWTSLDNLTFFDYSNTGLCEPQEAAFQDWLNGISTLQRTFFSCLSIFPTEGGNQGSVTATVASTSLDQATQFFSENTSVELQCPGGSITGDPVLLRDDGLGVSVTFDLLDQPLGMCDVRVTGNGGTIQVITDGFEIKDGRMPEIWVDVHGPTFIRSFGQARRYTILYGNRGNLDALMVPLTVSFNTVGSWGVSLPIRSMTEITDEHLVDPTTLSDTLRVGNTSLLPLIFPVIPAGSSGSFDLLLDPSGVSGGIQVFVSALPPLIVESSEEETARRVQQVLIGSKLSSTGNTPISSECGRALFNTTLSAVSAFVPLEACASAFAGFGGLAISFYELMREADEDPAGSEAAWAFTGFSNAAMGLALSASECGLRGNPATNAVLTVTKLFSGFALGQSSFDIGRHCFPASAAETRSAIVASFDPNEKRGSGEPDQPNYLSEIEPFRYSILFENLSKATAAAQEVFVTDTLDTATLDLSTFSFGPITWGESGRVVPPAGQLYFNTQVDLRPEHNLLLDIVATLNKETGVVRWVFRSLDPATGQLTEDPLAGFLPPNVVPPKGEGRVTFTVTPVAALATGATIRNRARIVFDVNDPIDTNTWVNTIDDTPPTSQVQSLNETQRDTSFVVTWNGSDLGAGVANYTIFVSSDGGPFEPWLINTPDTSAAFFADSTYSAYAFYSLARDGAGNQENKEATAEAVTEVVDSGGGGEEVSTEEVPLPTEFVLRQNYPNPFNTITRIQYDLPNTVHVELAVYDVLGRKQAELVNQIQSPGRYSITWQPNGFTSGVYFYRLHAGSFVQSRMIVLRK